MESLYHETNGILEQTQGYFVRLEQAVGEEEFHRLQTEISRRLDYMWSNCERLDMLAGKEPIARRQNAKIRVDQLKYDIQHINAAMQSQINRYASRQREQMEREDLLNTKFTTNAASRDSETSILINNAMTHGDSLTRVNSHLDNVLAQGAEILGGLHSQSSTLKGIKRKVLDVANTLGMSSTVIRLIERRGDGDKIILISGIIATCIFMIIVIKYFT
ncbi:Golgi SNAP receptor complex member 2-like isoform X2 [Eurytemora carolleeae]|uniref:Golgi SNAP receptor complex member 2-like isoform X2 n=1 Tax=Eurytemora carolleeae TaxID=1294199 RepID=UPI000C78B071|nr:Golgi SNAP receptor complex member 2-like isoform X2 [Eurytemora carolleeae]XP_023338459.1 Golgi SNAP receptor complex member 2-like isoform X2 [Eurytemora carolleeae]XP_023338460.1 Golgi SNAP receptor complex member 2-like isoform X2 [Eurytemora carolleeae]|eukprot:XP_023338458.1 Golgi SNAP receptor complex member 2-like isoform X2 [Eurytemora affinis]